MIPVKAVEGDSLLLFGFTPVDPHAVIAPRFEVMSITFIHPMRRNKGLREELILVRNILLFLMISISMIQLDRNSVTFINLLHDFPNRVL